MYETVGYNAIGPRAVDNYGPWFAAWINNHKNVVTVDAYHSLVFPLVGVYEFL